MRSMLLNTIGNRDHWLLFMATCRIIYLYCQLKHQVSVSVLAYSSFFVSRFSYRRLFSDVESPNYELSQRNLVPNMILKEKHAWVRWARRRLKQLWYLLGHQSVTFVQNSTRPKDADNCPSKSGVSEALSAYAVRPY